MKIYHTSPSEIKKINKHGLFNDMLFFSDKPYSMSNGPVIVYSIEISPDSVFDIERLFFEYDPSECAELQYTIDAVAGNLGISTADACDLLDNSEHIIDNADASFYIQAQQGNIAKALGYRAAMSTDEQGQVYIVPMFGRESELSIEK